VKGAFRCASGGPFFSVLLEKNGNKRGTASKILSCIKLRGKSPEKPKGFFWSVQGGTGGNRNPPRLVFFSQSFRIFSFGEAKEKTERQPQIFNTSSYLAVRLKMLRLFVYSTPVTS
jgi:hypothetical protein